jgi:hypothetical protein
MFIPRLRFLLPASLGLLLCARTPAATLLQNGAFSGGADGWTLSGGAAVIVTGELNDNPYARLPDGPLVIGFQKAENALGLLGVTFDFFPGLMSTKFPSPGGFPDTAFATLFFGESEAAVRPAEFAAASTLNLFDFDAVNGLRGLPSGAVTGPSPARPGWVRYSATFPMPAGQPWLALTFQNLNANGTAGDSAFLVDNVDVFSIPEPSVALLLAGGLLALIRRRRASL